jgi:Zn-finger nucleic acid-binding protein
MTLSLGNRGHALETDFFLKKERELVEKLQGHMAVANAVKTGIKCPKCEGTWTEADFQHIRLDVCDKCHGVWFDPGELAQVLEKDRDGGWFSRLFG